MRDYRDAKAMAQTLRAVLSEKNIALTHGETLELIAKALGAKDWNTLSAKIQADKTLPSIRERGHKGAKSPAPERTLPLVLLRDVVVFPNMTLPIFAGREKTIRSIEHARRSDCRVFLITQREPADEHPSADRLYQIGVVGTVLGVATSSEGLLMSFVRGEHRAALVQLTTREHFDVAAITRIEDGYGDAERTRLLSEKLTHDLALYLQAHAEDVPVWRRRTPQDSDLSRLADAIASRLPIAIAEKQRLLETADVPGRVEQLLQLMEQKRRAA